MGCLPKALTRSVSRAALACLTVLTPKLHSDCVREGSVISGQATTFLLPQQSISQNLAESIDYTIVERYRAGVGWGFYTAAGGEATTAS